MESGRPTTWLFTNEATGEVMRKRSRDLESVRAALLERAGLDPAATVRALRRTATPVSSPHAGRAGRSLTRKTRGPWRWPEWRTGGRGC